MGKAGGYVLKLSADRYKRYKESIDYYGYFAEPVKEFKHSRNFPLVCFILSPNGKITYLAKGRRGVVAGIDFRRLNIEEPTKLSTPLSVSKIIGRVSSRVRKRAAESLRHGGLFTPKSFESVVDVICSLSPESKSILYLFSRSRAEKIKKLTSRTRQVLGMQKETVATAIKISGLSPKLIQEWEPLDTDDQISFLEGLPKARLREDAMVYNDLINIPGYNLLKTMPHNSAVFEGDGIRLTVVLANRQPLEQLLGTDLIYYNETYKSFIMVQYKAMEKEGNDVGFRLPNSQLAEELSRMELVLKELQKCKPNDCCDGYRLNENPFFLKLCSRTVFEPDNVNLFPGMYIPFDYWRLLENDSAIVGPRGGRKVGYDSAGRYFRKTEFLSIVSNAWVGTTIMQSRVLELAIRQTIESGKAITFAIKKDDSNSNNDQINQLGLIGPAEP